MLNLSGNSFAEPWQVGGPEVREEGWAEKQFREPKGRAQASLSPRLKSSLPYPLPPLSQARTQQACSVATQLISSIGPAPTDGHLQPQLADEETGHKATKSYR